MLCSQEEEEEEEEGKLEEEEQRGRETPYFYRAEGKKGGREPAS